ncbi:hypothetical protein H5410_030870, partial [Solanum commersonii]
MRHVLCYYAEVVFSECYYAESLPRIIILTSLPASVNMPRSLFVNAIILRSLLVNVKVIGKWFLLVMII